MQNLFNHLLLTFPELKNADDENECNKSFLPDCKIWEWCMPRTRNQLRPHRDEECVEREEDEEKEDEVVAETQRIAPKQVSELWH